MSSVRLPLRLPSQFLLRKVRRGQRRRNCFSVVRVWKFRSGFFKAELCLTEAGRGAFQLNRVGGEWESVEVALPPKGRGTRRSSLRSFCPPPFTARLVTSITPARTRTPFSSKEPRDLANEGLAAGGEPRRTAPAHLRRTLPPLPPSRDQAPHRRTRLRRSHPADSYALPLRRQVLPPQHDHRSSTFVQGAFADGAGARLECM